MVLLTQSLGISCLLLALVVGSGKTESCSLDADETGLLHQTDETGFLQQKVGVATAVENLIAGTNDDESAASSSAGIDYAEGIDEDGGTAQHVGAGASPGVQLVQRTYGQVLQAGRGKTDEFIQMRHTVERRGVSRIPCKIVQTYSFPLGSLPEAMEQARLTWERLNPEYEYHYMTDADMLLYVQMKGRWLPGLVETFSALTMPAEKADVFRFLYIYNEGGVYADIDTALRKPMREVLQPTDHFVVFSTVKGVLEGFWFAAAQYHPLLKHVLERIVDEVRGHTILANGTCADCSLYPLMIAGPWQLTVAATNLFFPEVSKSLPQRIGNKDPHAWHHFELGTLANPENTFHLRVPGILGQQDVMWFKYRGYAKDLHSTNNTYWKEERKESLRIKKKASQAT